MTHLGKNQHFFKGKNSNKGNLFFNLLFTVLYYIFTLFSVISIDENVLFWTSMILWRFLNKEISKMLISKIYQISFSIIQRRCSQSQEVHYVLICFAQHGVGQMSNSPFLPLYCRCFKFKTLTMLKKEQTVLNILSQQRNWCALGARGVILTSMAFT